MHILHLFCLVCELCNINFFFSLGQIYSTETNMHQLDQTIVQVLTPGDIKSDEKSVHNQQDEGNRNGNRNSINNGVQNKLDETGGEDVEKETFFKKFGGMLMALSASFFFSVSFLIIKILGNNGFKAFGCSVLFNLGVLIPCLIGILLHEIGPKAQERSRIFKEIWPLSVSSKSTTLKILLVKEYSISIH